MGGDVAGLGFVEAVVAWEDDAKMAHLGIWNNKRDAVVTRLLVFVFGPVCRRVGLSALRLVQLVSRL